MRKPSKQPRIASQVTRITESRKPRKPKPLFLPLRKLYVNGHDARYVRTLGDRSEFSGSGLEYWNPKEALRIAKWLTQYAAWAEAKARK